MQSVDASIESKHLKENLNTISGDLLEAIAEVVRERMARSREHLAAEENQRLRAEYKHHMENLR